MEVGEWSISSPASKFLLGAPWAEKLVHGWVHPLRFSSNQLRVIGSCSSWHPGLFKQMAACTSDIQVAFTTDSSEVVLDLNIDEVPKGASSVLQLLKATYFKKLSSVFVTVDGKPYKNFSLDDAGEHTLSIHLETETSEDNLARLPGFNDTHHVYVYLPCLQSASVKNLRGNGTFFSPDEPKKKLVVFGDSIAQGFVVERPDKTWPHCLAKRMKLDVVNQGIGGQVYQPGSYTFIEDASLVIVALGANYRYEKCTKSQVTYDIQNSLWQISQMYADTRVVVLTPTPYFEETYPTHPYSCFAEVSQIIEEIAGKFGLQCISGEKLLPQEKKYFADDVHPNSKGAALLAKNLFEALKQPVQDSLF